MNESKQFKESLLRLESQTIANITHLAIEESKIVSTGTTLLLRYLFPIGLLWEKKGRNCYYVVLRNDSNIFNISDKRQLLILSDEAGDY